jgi:hypothetical protein
MLVHEVLVDFSAQAHAQNEVSKLFNVPKGTTVHAVEVDVLKAEGAAGTVDIGDYKRSDDTVVDIDGYHDGLDINAVATKSSHDNGAGYAAGKYYEIDAWIGIAYLTATGAGTAKLLVRLICSRAKQNSEYTRV